MPVKFVQIQNDHDRYASEERCPDDPDRPGCKLRVQDPAGLSDAQVTSWVAHLRSSLAKNPEDLLPTDFAWRGAAAKAAPPALNPSMTASTPQFPPKVNKASGSKGTSKASKIPATSKAVAGQARASKQKAAVGEKGRNRKEMRAPSLERGPEAEVEEGLPMPPKDKSQPKPKPVWEKGQATAKATSAIASQAMQKNGKAPLASKQRSLSPLETDESSADAPVSPDGDNNAAAFDELDPPTPAPIRELVVLSHALLLPTHPAWKPSLVSALYLQKYAYRHCFAG